MMEISHEINYFRAVIY